MLYLAAVEMSLLHLKFVPTLLLWTDSEKNLYMQDNYPTGVKEMDPLLLENLTSDTINFKNAFLNDEWEVYQYQFDTTDNLIHLWVRNPTGANMSPAVLKAAVDIYGPSAEDTWMEGDIAIVDNDTAQQWGHEAVELRPYLKEVWLLVPAGNGEYNQHRVDVAKL